jgi:lipid-binding SYLF domain-containing protein
MFLGKMARALLCGLSVVAYGIDEMEQLPLPDLRIGQEDVQEAVLLEDALPTRVPQVLLNRSHCVALLMRTGQLSSDLHENARGLVSCRTSEGWSLPSALLSDGEAPALKSENDVTDILLLFVHPKASRDLRKDLSLGRHYSVSTGPLALSEDNPELRLHSRVFSYARRGDHFVPLAMDGAEIKIDHSTNDKLYPSYRGQVKDLFQTRAQYEDLLSPLHLFMKTLEAYAPMSSFLN